jgi:hypothetical protein
LAKKINLSAIFWITRSLTLSPQGRGNLRVHTIPRRNIILGISNAGWGIYLGLERCP